jgi:c-di-GMP-binding flagellar brake protein YcgR
MAHGRNILKSERRKRTRTPVSATVLLCWTDERGHEHYGRGRCLDLSESGCAVELMEGIPLRTNISMRFPESDVSTFASVRHVTRKGSKFHVGLEFPQPVRIPIKETELAEAI